VQRARQAQSEDGREHESRGDESRFYSTLGYTERLTGR
jgi:hypothetical protein